MSQTALTNFHKVIIQGLQKVEDVEPDDSWTATTGEDSELYNLSLNLREDEQMWPGLWQKIQDCGFGVPRKLVHGDVEYKKDVPITVVREYDEVLVVADDQASTPTTIKMSETLISHTNTHQVPPLEFHSHLEGVVRDEHGFWMSFERTTRIPDDNKLHHLPPSLGRYQLFSVEKYSQHLPKNVTETGGVFFSMWQREAMWINFRPTTRKYAVRVFVGRVNAITGREMQNEQDTKNEDKLQDYVVIPSQNWLDGICVAPGVVRQFVAMPLGSGYTVEGQKTSEEKHGGLQIEVTPQMERGQRSWAYTRQQHVTYPKDDFIKAVGLSECRTPRELGCKAGDILKSYPTDKEFREPFRIQDLFAHRAEQKAKGGASQENDSLLGAAVIMKAASGIRPMPVRARKLSESPPPSFALDRRPREPPTIQSFGMTDRMLRSEPRYNYDKLSGQPASQNLAPYSSNSQDYNTGASVWTPPDSILPLSSPSAQQALLDHAPHSREALVQQPSQPTQPPVQQVCRPATTSEGERAHSASSEEPYLGRRRYKRTITTNLAQADGMERHIYEMPGDIPALQEADGCQLSEKEYMVKREEVYKDVDPNLPHNKDKTDLMELTEEQAKNVKTLGLAAGGKLIQDIYKDRFTDTMWNHAGARILHVHMIDPESCEMVTHIVPQPPPMAVEDYVKSGGQFFVVEEKVDERLNGGDFDNVKSVSQMDQHLSVTTEPGFDPKKPEMCTTCERRLCDCIIRPCSHQFCNVCIKRLEQGGDMEQSGQQAGSWKCPTCNSPVSHVAGFSAPMNLPGEERLLRTKVPVHVLKIEDGRMRLSSTQTSRV